MMNSLSKFNWNNFNINNAKKVFLIAFLIISNFVFNGLVYATGGAQISNGTVTLGVNSEGNLIVGGVGLRYVPTNGESLSPGCDCEGWGVADAVTGRYAKAGAVFGYRNIVIESFTNTTDSATSVVRVVDGSGDFLRVTHAFSPSVSPNLYQVDVTIENISGADIEDLRYRRVMDWDIPPTTFREMVTLVTSGAENLLYSSDNGFADGNPLVPGGSIRFVGEATDSGPADHGALFDFGFEELANGAKREFTIFYGAAENDVESLAALTAVSADNIYSFGKPNPSSSSVSEDGSPNTFIFGFKGVGGPSLAPGLKDVKVISVLSTNEIDLDNTSFSQSPFSIETIGEETFIEWRFDTISVDQLENLDYEVILKNPVPGEARLVTHRLELTYIDINGNPVRRDLGEQVVNVLPSLFSVSVTTDKMVYMANEDVSIASIVSNLSEFDATTDLRVSIYDELGVLVEQVGLFPDVSVVANGSTDFSSLVFNTGTLLLGNYTARAELVDDQGNSEIQAESGFTIVHSLSGDPQATLRITVDKPIYNTSDQVTLESLSVNVTDNVLIREAKVKIRILNPNGSLNIEIEQSIGDLAAGNQRLLNALQSLSSVEQGAYTVEAVLLDDSDNLLASDQTGFQVLESIEITIVGDVQVLNKKVSDKGQQSCTNTISNTGTLSFENSIFRQVLIDIDKGTNTIFAEQPINVIEAGEAYQFVTDIDLSDLESGQYSCVLQYQNGADWSTLAYDFFELDIKIAANIDINPNNMRLLILIDGAGDCVNTQAGCSANEIKDPLGPDNFPTVIEQRTALEELLNSQSWSYTIVTEADDFKRELRSGTYTAYALFSEQVKLDKSTQEELREAIFKGEGLLIAGDHDHRNSHLDDSLGVKVTGRQTAPDSLTLLEVEEYSALVAEFTILDKTRRTQLLSADVVANYTGTSNIAITHNDFGYGHSVYAGFDILAQLAVPSVDPVFSEVLLAMLRDIQPQASDDYLTDSVVPVQLTLNNHGVSTSGEVHIVKPEGVTFIDSGKAVIQEDGSLLWVFDLAKDGEEVLDIWLQLPSQVGLLTLDAILKTGVDPELDDYDALQLAIPVSEAPELSDLIDQAIALQASDKGFKQVVKILQKASNYLDQGNLNKALTESLKAANTLSKISALEVKELRKALAISIRRLEMQLP